MPGGSPGGKERSAAPARTPDNTRSRSPSSVGLPGVLLCLIFCLERHAVQDTSLSDIALCLAIFTMIYTILWGFECPDGHRRSKRRTTRRRRFERGSPKLFIPKLPRFKWRNSSISMLRSNYPDLGSSEVISSNYMSAKDKQPSMLPTPRDCSLKFYMGGPTARKEANYKEEVNKFLQNILEEYECRESVLGDGNCYFRAILQHMEIPEVNRTLNVRARDIHDHIQLRKSVVQYGRTHRFALAQQNLFIQNAVENGVDGKAFDKYLDDMEKERTFADDVIIPFTAMFLGQHIWYTEYPFNTKEHPWSKVEVPGATGPPITLALLRESKHIEPIHQRSSQSTNETTQQMPPSAPNQPKSGEKHKQPFSEKATQAKSPHKDLDPPYDAFTARSVQPKLKSRKDPASNESKSQDTDLETCKGCGWTGRKLLMHTGKKPECEAANDVEALKLQKKIQRREKNAARMKDLYHNDPEESSRKRAASKDKEVWLRCGANRETPCGI